MRSKTKELKKGVKEFFDNSTIHGVSYILDVFSFVERLFWALITAIMLTLAISLIFQALEAWSQQPTALSQATKDVSIREIPFPTVTICADYSGERWGYLRNLLNLIKFQCRGISDCRDTLPIRNHLGNNGKEVMQDLMEYTYQVMADNVLEWLKANPDTFFYTDNFMITKYIKDTINHKLDSNPYSIEPLGLQKLVSKMNNFDLYSALDMDLSKTPDYHIINATNERGHLEFYALLFKLVLAFPPPGKLGTLLANYNMTQFDSLDSLKGNYYPEEGANEFNLNQFTFHLFDILINKDLGVSAYDIPAILDPVPDYVKPHKSQRLFPFTIFKQINRTQPEYLGRPRGQVWDPLPKLWSVRNYFGKLLTPHLKAVMEVMYHCTHRTRSLNRDRFSRPELQDLYANLEKKIGFVLESGTGKDNGFYPSWQEHKWFKTPYWLPINHANISFFFEYSSESKNAPDVEESEEEMKRKDAVIEELRQTHQHRQMMLYCKGPGTTKASCRSKFEPVLTDKGICHSFNNLGFSQTFNDHHQGYFKTFAEIYEPELGNKTIVLNENAGSTYGMTFILDDGISLFQPGTIVGTFTISISDEKNYFHATEVAIECNTGQVSHILVTPTMTSSSDSFAKLDLETRGCRYPHENTNSMFKFYSQEACLFECRLRLASRTCNCIPWNYPTPPGQAVRPDLCDAVSAYCFDQQMKDLNSAQDQCPCLPNCEGISYKAYPNTYDLQHQRECDLQDWEGGRDWLEPDLSFIVSEKIRHLDGEEFTFFQDKVQYPDPTEAKQGYLGIDFEFNNRYFRYADRQKWKEKCSGMVNFNLAMIKIEVTSATVKQIRRDVSASFVQKIAALGGHIGLCTGMSILSLVEVIFWSIKLSFKYFAKSSDV